MASKLINLASHEAPNHLELSLREAYDLFHPKLTPPLKLIIPSPPEYLILNKAILYGVLCEPFLARTHIKYLHAIVNDGYSSFIKLLTQIVDGLYPKLLESPKVQLIWVVSVMIDVLGIGFDSLLVSLLRQIVGGDFSNGNLWLSYEMVNLFLSKFDVILDEEPIVLTSALYSYLRLLADHYRLPRTPSSTELKQKEIGFCIRMLREQFHLCLTIGRDLIRLLQDLVHIPEFRAIWRDLVLNPGSFRTSGFSDISHVYGKKTSSRYILLRITPEMEAQLRFLLTHVKLGTQRRHQVWFARKFLFVQERETLISDIVRFICCAHHPSNEILQSDVTPRWAVIGWLLKSCTKKYIEANVKLALFYDWLFFDEKVDNVMNIEPAMLLMVNSIPRYVDMTNSLLEFLLLLVDNYDLERKDFILNRVSSAISTLVRRRVIRSLDVLTSCDILSPFVKEMLQGFMSRAKSGILKEPNPSDVEVQTHSSVGLPISDRNVELSIKPVDVPKLTDSTGSFDSVSTSRKGQIDDIGNLVRKIGENLKRSNKMGQEIVEKILLLYVNSDSHENSGDFTSELLASEVKNELELAGYKLFSPLESLPISVDVDDDVQSPTAGVIRTFVFSQHQRIKELLLSWSKNGCHVGERLLSYALRLAYEAHLVGYGAKFASEINYDKMMPLLKCHIEGYFTFIWANGNVVNGASSVDRKLISEMIDGAFSSYRAMLAFSKDVLSKELEMPLGKILSIDILSSSLWKNKKFKIVFHAIFSHLSDLSLGDEDVIRLLVSQLEYDDLVSLKIDVGLKEFSVFGKDVHNVVQLIGRSIFWEPVEQHKFWGLIKSELSISEFPAEKLLLDCFSLAELDRTASGIVVDGLMTLYNCCAPTPELVGAVMLLPNNKFPDFAAALLSHWSVTNTSTLLDSVAHFLDILEKKNENIPLDWGEIVINQSAVVFLLHFLEAFGVKGINILDKLAPNLSDKKTRLGNPSVAMDVG